MAGPVLDFDPEAADRSMLPAGDTRDPPAQFDPQLAGAIGLTIALAVLLWLLWRRGMVQLAWEKALRPFWREFMLFILLGTIAFKLW